MIVTWAASAGEQIAASRAAPPNSRAITFVPSCCVGQHGSHCNYFASAWAEVTLSRVSDRFVKGQSAAATRTIDRPGPDWKYPIALESIPGRYRRRAARREAEPARDGLGGLCVAINRLRTSRIGPDRTERVALAGAILRDGRQNTRARTARCRCEIPM